MWCRGDPGDGERVVVRDGSLSWYARVPVEEAEAAVMAFLDDHPDVRTPVRALVFDENGDRERLRFDRG